ncbi:MAG TPA: hypothetical protein VF060_12635 [Trebonia sp.]
MVQPPSGRPPQYPSPPGQLPRYPSGGNAYGQYPIGSPRKRGNGFAAAGIILAILIWPLGLIFAIVGLSKSGERAGDGRVLSIVAIVLSVIVGAASISVAAFTVIYKPTVSDPGCVAAESTSREMNSTLSSDDQAIARDANNRAAGIADINRLAADDQSFVTRLNAAQAEATDQSVRDKIGRLSSDLSGMLSAIQAAEHGDSGQLDKIGTYGSRLQGDGQAVDQVCSLLG